MILFSDIFDRAFNLFDDPDIAKKYYCDRAGFQRDMLGFLMIGKDKFTYPVTITDKLSEYDEPQGVEESDNGNDTNMVVLNQEVANKGEGVGFTFFINDELVFGEYIPETNSVRFDREVKSTDTWRVSWFYAGAFTADFSTCLRGDFPTSAIIEKIINILAYALLSAWGDKEVGRVLEVRNILTDTDFKMYSPANSAKAKMEWRDKMNANMDTLVSELNWRIMSTPRGGSRFGK